MSDEFDDAVTDFEPGEEVMLTVAISPYHVTGVINGYSEFLPGLFLDVTGVIEEPSPVSEKEEQEIYATVSGYTLDKLVTYLPEYETLKERIHWVETFAMDYGYAFSMDFILNFYAFEDLLDRAVEAIVAEINADRSVQTVYMMKTMPIKTYFPYDNIVKMELMKDAIEELDLYVFKESLDDTLEQLRSPDVDEPSIADEE